MNTKKYQWLLYIITATIAVTIAVQFYWNYKNFQENSIRVNNEIQIGLDNAIEQYYSSLTKNSFFTLMNKSTGTSVLSKGHQSFSTFWSADTLMKSNQKGKLKINSLEIKTTDKEEYKKLPSLLDSIFIDVDTFSFKTKKSKIKANNFNLLQNKQLVDSIHIIKGLQTVVIAYQNDTLNLNTLDSLFAEQLQKNNIKTSFYFDFIKADTVHSTNKKDVAQYNVSKTGKSTYLKPYESIVVYHEAAAFDALKRSAGGILLSFLLSATVIACLFYLLHTIKNQKALAEIKNDLISNITHEFKTPIATISTALEAIESFNAIDDKEKTKKYLSMSSSQLSKLNIMVEKLLETATLDSEKVLLEKEELAIDLLLEKLIAKFTLLAPSKSISFTTSTSELELLADPFHLENAISNILDNAVKYGGDTITIETKQDSGSMLINITDNGKGIPKQQQARIFDKFYRVPTGNQHDVKGFGIGLYYTKAIIEKHGGTVEVSSTSSQTKFSITLPYGR